MHPSIKSCYTHKPAPTYLHTKTHACWHAHNKTREHQALNRVIRLANEASKWKPHGMHVQAKHMGGVAAHNTPVSCASPQNPNLHPPSHHLNTLRLQAWSVHKQSTTHAKDVYKHTTTKHTALNPCWQANNKVQHELKRGNQKRTRLEVRGHALKQ